MASRTGLLVGLGVGLLALLGFSRSSKATDQTSKGSSGDTLSSISTDPAMALSQVMAAMGNPVKFSQGAAPTSSGRKYDIAVWQKGGQKLLMVYSLAPNTFYVQSWTRGADNIVTSKVLIDVHPDDAGYFDLQTIVSATQ